MTARSDLAIETGRRLREIREQQRLSLADVEHQSRRVFKAMAVGSYERADREPPTSRLAALCEFYGVTLLDVLPLPPLVSAAFTAITAAKEAEKQAMAIEYERELADLRARMHLEAQAMAS